MSSQTTDTPGTTTTSAVDRSGATSQTYPNPQSFANQRFRQPQPRERDPHPETPAHTKSAPYSRLFIRGSVAISPHQRRRLELLYTPPRPHTNPPHHHPHTPQKPRHHTETKPPTDPTPNKPAKTQSLCTGSHPGLTWPAGPSTPPASAVGLQPVVRRRALNARRAGNQMVAGPSSSPWLQEY